MKSSTLKRSNLSKEKMAVLEALSKYRHDSLYNNSPNEYVRPAKEKELDLLWQNFKISQKSEKSPSVFLLCGFIAGMIVMLALSTLFSMHSKNTATGAAKQTSAKEGVNLIPAGSESFEKTETYTVQSGDTVESILIRFYGSYSPEKADLIQKTNSMENINKLQIGQKLIIPIE